MLAKQSIPHLIKICQLWQYQAVLYLLSPQHISVQAETQGYTPEKHIMRSDGKSCLVSDMNSIHLFFHVRQYSQKELPLTRFNFAETKNIFSSVGVFSLHLKFKKNLCRILLLEMATHVKNLVMSA
jgi:hypothetical protein